eukprot:m.355973 g.355973  ORF g.355973 m.355973 type:complete len:374 (-) comp16603_c0_seq12:62-1183(-)
MFASSKTTEEATALPRDVPTYVVRSLEDIAYARRIRRTDPFHLVIPDGETCVGVHAFAGCTGLRSVTFPASVTTIRQHSFSESGLPSVTIPNTVTTIGKSAFSDCERLSSITISESITTLEEGVFENCLELVLVSIPNGVTKIETGAFRGCERLTSISIPDKVTTIGSGAFNECISLKSVDLPDGLTTIEDFAFFVCTELASVDLPRDLKTIPLSAFSESGLTSITIPEGVDTIEGLAFEGCKKLIVVVLPASLQSFNESAFYNCPHLSYVVAPPQIRDKFRGFKGSPLLERIEPDTPKTRLHALRLQCWSRQTHRLCTEPQRSWVATVLTVARRLDGLIEDGAPVPRLAIEMWTAILGYVRLEDLGPRSVML